MQYLHNLCPNDNDTFSPVPAPAVIVREEMTPLGQVGDNLVLGSPGRISAYNTSTHKLTELTECGGMPDCAAGADNSRLVVMDPVDGPVVLAGDNLDRQSRSLPNLAVRVYPYRTGTATMYVDGVSLKNEYGPGEITDTADRDLLHEAATDAYRRLATDVVGYGSFFQPMVVRVEISDATGRKVYRGPEQLITPPDSSPVDGTLTMPMDTRSHSQYTTLDVPTFRVAVDIDAADGSDIDLTGYTVTLYRSPQIHPYDASGKGHGIATVVRSGVSDQSVIVSLNGAEKGLSKSADERSRSIVSKIISSRHLLARVGSVTLADGSSTSHIDGFDAMPGSLDDECAGFSRIMAAKVHGATVAELYRHRCDMPNTFTARVCAHTPAAVAWGDITIRRFCGYTPADFAAEVSADNVHWWGVATVTFADGTTARRVISRTGSMPVKMNAVLAYPDPAARHIRLVVEPDVEGGRPVVWSADLQPDLTGCIAVSVNSFAAMRPGREDTEAWVDSVTDSRPDDMTMPGLVVIAAADSPLTPALTADIGCRVTALNAATSTSGAWDFGRVRFYAFTVDKALLLNVAAGMKSVATGSLAWAGVEYPSAVVSGPSGKTYFASGRSIYILNGTMVGVLGIMDSEIDRLGYDAGRGEVVAANSSGSAEVYHIDSQSSDTVFTTTSPGPSNRWLSTRSGIFVESQSGLLDVSVDGCRTNTAPTDIKYITVVRVPLTKTPRTIRSVVWHVEADSFDGTLAAARNYLGLRRADMCRYTVKGRLGAPVQMKLASRRMSSAVLEIAAKVSNDARIDTPDVEIA